MIPPIPAISSAAGVGPLSAAAPGASPTAATAGSSASGFASSLGRAIDNLQSVTQAADTSATSAAAGQGNVADVMVATSKAELETELFTTVRDKAVAAYNQIMGMSA